MLLYSIGSAILSVSFSPLSRLNPRHHLHLLSAAHLHVDAALLHASQRAVAHLLAEAQVERAEVGASRCEGQKRGVGDQMLAAAEIEGEDVRAMVCDGVERALGQPRAAANVQRCEARAARAERGEPVVAGRVGTERVAR